MTRCGLRREGEHARPGCGWPRPAANRLPAIQSCASIIADLPRQYGKPGENRFHQGDPNNGLQPGTVTQATAPAGCSGVSPPVGTRTGTVLQPAAGTAALQGSRKDYAAPTALGGIELKIPIKFSTRFGNGRILRIS